MAQNIYLPVITPIIKSILGNKKTIAPFPAGISRTLLLVKTLIEQGKFNPVIDRELPFEEIIEVAGKNGYD